MRKLTRKVAYIWKLAKWAGPCDAMGSIFKRFKTEYGESLSFYQVSSSPFLNTKNK
jgi:hypothetical protein